MATRFWMLECLLAISYTDETKDAALKSLCHDSSVGTDFFAAELPRSFFVSRTGGARAGRLLRFAAEVVIAAQVVRDRRQRPFDRGCRPASALKLAHPALFF